MRNHIKTALAGLCLVFWMGLGTVLGVPLALNDGIRTTPLTAISLAAGAVSVVLFVVLGVRFIVNGYRTRRLLRTMPQETRLRIQEQLRECEQRARLQTDRELAEM